MSSLEGMPLFAHALNRAHILLRKGFSPISISTKFEMSVKSPPELIHNPLTRIIKDHAAQTDAYL